MAKKPRQDGRDGLKASLGAALSHDRKRREKSRRQQATIERAEQRRRDKSANDIISANDKIMVDAVVTPEARSKAIIAPSISNSWK
jgi:hypothetical protein